MKTRSPRRDPRAVYQSSKSNAKRRGIAWKLTYRQWWQLWAPRWQERCDGAALELCRAGDAGIYELGNVRVATRADNLAERSAVVADALARIQSRAVSLPAMLAELESRAVDWAMVQTAGNKTQAAALLGITFRAFRYLEAKHVRELSM